MCELGNNIYNVGAKKDGVFYNAYLVMGKKTALIDTVPTQISQDYIENIEKIMPVTEIDYLVCNHTEQDRSGAVKRILELNQNIEIIGTIASIRNLKEITNMSFNEHIAKDMAELDLGDAKLQFCIVPNLNWPDSMVTYEEQSGTLFSCDMFSTYCECDDFNEYRICAKEYFDRYFAPYKGFVKTAIKKISQLNIKRICAGNGNVGSLTENISDILTDYAKWCETEIVGKKTVTVFYSSTYGSTAKMADKICNTLRANDIDVNLICNIDDDTEKYLNNSDALVFGVPTVNNNAVQIVRDALALLKPMSVKGKPYFTFGSYGWSGEGVQITDNTLKLLKMKPFDKPYTVLFVPSDEDIDALGEYTKRFSDMIQNI